MSQLPLLKLLTVLRGTQGGGGEDSPSYPPGIPSLFSSHEAPVELTPTKAGSGMNTEPRPANPSQAGSILDRLGRTEEDG